MTERYRVPSITEREILKKLGPSFSFICSPDREAQARAVLRQQGVGYLAEGLTPFGRLEGICPRGKQVEIAEALRQEDLLLEDHGGFSMRFGDFPPGEYVPPPINSRAA